MHSCGNQGATTEGSRTCAERPIAFRRRCELCARESVRDLHLSGNRVSSTKLAPMPKHVAPMQKTVALCIAESLHVHTAKGRFGSWGIGDVEAGDPRVQGFV